MRLASPAFKTPSKPVHPRIQLLYYILIEIADLKAAFRLPALILFGNILTLVVQFFTFCQTDLHFNKAAFKINF